MLTRWDPFSEMSRLQDHLARAAHESEEKGRSMRPAVDIREEAAAFVVHVELPGVKIEDIHVEVERGVLNIRGERKFSTDETVRKSYRRVEQSYGSFSRAFSLPDNVDTDAITADLTAGILDVRIPKKQSASPRKIAVNPAS